MASHISDGPAITAHLSTFDPLCVRFGFFWWMHFLTREDSVQSPLFLSASRINGSVRMRCGEKGQHRTPRKFPRGGQRCPQGSLVFTRQKLSHCSWLRGREGGHGNHLYLPPPPLSLLCIIPSNPAVSDFFIPLPLSIPQYLTYQ